MNTVGLQLGNRAFLNLMANHFRNFSKLELVTQRTSEILKCRNVDLIVCEYTPETISLLSGEQSVLYFSHCPEPESIAFAKAHGKGFISELASLAQWEKAILSCTKIQNFVSTDCEKLVSESNTANAITSLSMDELVLLTRLGNGESPQKISNITRVHLSTVYRSLRQLRSTLCCTKQELESLVQKTFLQ